MVAEECQMARWKQNIQNRTYITIRIHNKCVQNSQQLDRDRHYEILSVWEEKPRMTPQKTSRLLMRLDRVTRLKTLQAIWWWWWWWWCWTPILTVVLYWLLTGRHWYTLRLNRKLISLILNFISLILILTFEMIWKPGL